MPSFQTKWIFHFRRVGKALKIDNIGEMIVCLQEKYPQIIILRLFNTILERNEIIPECLVGIITPIVHKSVSKTDPSAYIIGEYLFYALFENFSSRYKQQRIVKFTIANDTLSTNQLGFLPGNPT